jgi:hypothetical protein
MRYLVECEIYADLGDAAAETIDKTLSVVGHVTNLRIEIMTFYTLNVRLNAPVHPNRPPSS